MEAELLAWHRQSARELPWRSTRDPYAILVSEVMAQQNRLESVYPPLSSDFRDGQVPLAG